MAPIVNEPGGGSETGGFFIAGRLRGIPLVSQKRDDSLESGTNRTNKTSQKQQTSNRKQEKSSSDDRSNQEAISKGETTTVKAMTSNTDDIEIADISQDQRPSQVGKRETSTNQGGSLIESHGARIQSDSEILFKQTGITSSIANLVKSTTRRPAQQQQQQPRRTTTTTTRRPVITTRRAQPKQWTTSTRRARMTTTTTTTTRKPKTPVARGTNKPAVLAKLISSGPNQGPTTAPMTRFIEPISSHKMSTLEAASALSGGSTLPFITTSSSMHQQQTTTTMQPPSQQQLSEQPIRTTLTRSMQTLTTQPVNQRRTQQNVVQSRGGSNRILNDPRNGYAGENWYLFNRSDGSFSAFEILVLISNVLIVSTIILVILFNWVKMFKKRRRNGETSKKTQDTTTQPKQQHQQQQPIVTGPVNSSSDNLNNSNNNKLDATSDRASKMSLVSSGVSQITSVTTSANDALTTTTSTIASMGAPVGGNQVKASGQQSLEEAKRLAAAGQKATTDELIGSSGQQSAFVGDAQKIARDFNQSSANVANKAMAIVQPTENNLGSTAAHMDSGSLDKLKKELKSELVAGARSISRSVSDLSSGAVGGGGYNSRAEAQNTDGEAVARASATTTPDRVQTLEKLFKGTTKKDSQGSKERQKDDEGRLIRSSSSLESIELPNNLVESIKRTAPGPLRNQVDETLAPSPNLLLGEMVMASGADQAIKSAGPVQSEQQKVLVPEAKATTTTTTTATTSHASKSNNSAQQGQSSAESRPQNPMADGMAIDKRRQQPESNSKKSSSDEPTTKPMPTIKEASKSAETTEAPASSRAKPAAKEQPNNKPASQDKTATSTTTGAPRQQHQQQTAEVKNHQVVVNRLDKRKTNLEIVDLRDESVTGKMRSKPTSGGEQTGATDQPEGASSSAWISMDGVAVVQPHSIAADSPAVFAAGGGQLQQLASPTDPQAAASQMAATMSPSEIIESRFHVDYKSKRRQQQQQQQQQQQKANGGGGGQVKNSESMDSKQEEYVFNNIENELELDNKMKNRKYFVYVVHDGHFTAKKECIARIELPPKRRITLAELRQLISNSQDISLSSLRRNRFKFVTETYRLLNENEDAAVLHQVYPTQGVFLKLNVAEQENQVYPFKGGRNARLSSGGGGPGGTSSFAPGGSSLSNTTISSRRRANARTGGLRNPRPSGQVDSGMLPAIEVNNYGQTSSRMRASSVGRTSRQTGAPGYKRSKSSVQVGRNNRSSAGGGAGGMRRGTSGGNLSGNDDPLPSIDADDDLINRRPSYIGMPLAEMSEDRVRIITTSTYCSRPTCGRFATIRCGVCNQAHYCSVKCRIHDWPQHKQFCKRPRWRVWS